MTTVAYVSVIPKCDVCNLKGEDEDAVYDANTGRGWGYVCQYHFDVLGCSLGLGRGQKLLVPEKSN